MKIISIIFKLLILAILVLFSAINLQTIDFFYLPSQSISLPLILMLLIFLILGSILGMLSLLGRILTLRRETAELKKEIKKQNALLEEKNQIIKQQHDELAGNQESNDLLED